MKKRHSLVLVLMTMSTLALQAQQADGRVKLVMPAHLQQVCVTSDVEALPLSYIEHLAQGTSFSIVSDETDPQGYRHVKLQQYIDGVKVQNRMITLHLNPRAELRSINGQVATRQMAEASAQNLRCAPRDVKELLPGIDKAELVLFAPDRAGAELVKAYTYVKGFDRIYVDVQSGQELQRERLAYDIVGNHEGESVTGPADLFLGGTKTINSLKVNDSSYILYDADRGISTVECSLYTLEKNEDEGHMFATLQGNPGLSAEKIKELIYNQSDEFVNASADWTGHTYRRTLHGLTVESYYVNVLDENAAYMRASWVLSSTEEPVLPPVTMPVDDLRNDEALYFDFGGVDYPNDEPCSIKLELLDADMQIIGEPLLTNAYASADTFIYPEKVGPYQLTQVCQMTDFQPALDVHWGMEQVIDYYRETYNRNSFDNQGSPLHLLVNYNGYYIFGNSKKSFNAFASPSDDNIGWMFFGMAYDRAETEGGRPVVGLEVMGHEFTHLIARDLVYFGESGALNESYADIMGLSIDHKMNGYEGWNIGEGCSYVAEAFRSFEHPEKYKHPTCYMGPNYYVRPEDYNKTDDDDDYAGVHTNSSVQNYWYYLLVNGGKGQNALGQEYDVTDIDREEATAIAFYTLLYYGTPNMTFAEARESSIQEAEILFGEGSQQVISVTNAWAAVGVGERYDQTPTSVAGIQVPSAGVAYDLMGRRTLQAGLRIIRTADGSASLQYTR